MYKIRKWILVAASPALTALVTVQMPEAATARYPDAAIRAALATLAVPRRRPGRRAARPAAVQGRRTLPGFGSPASFPGAPSC